VSHLTGERYTGHGYLPGPDLEDVDNAAAAARGAGRKAKADSLRCAFCRWADVCTDPVGGAYVL